MRKNIIVALDCEDRDTAVTLVKQLPRRCCLKVGMQMFTLFGPGLVEELIDLGFDVFLDLKFHDIPNTVACAVRAACDMGVWMMTVHVQGGVEMLRAARSEIEKSSGRKPLLVGVTLLTSLDENDLLLTTRRQQTTEQYVVHLATMARDQRLDGVVCSASEALLIRQACGEDFLLVTPGIRTNNALDDQKRVASPREAVTLGADYLVIGRSITRASSPAAVLIDLYKQLDSIIESN